jgi:hypothetical protein
MGDVLIHLKSSLNFSEKSEKVRVMDKSHTGCGFVLAFAFSFLHTPGVQPSDLHFSHFSHYADKSRGRSKGGGGGEGCFDAREIIMEL